MSFKKADFSRWIHLKTALLVFRIVKAKPSLPEIIASSSLFGLAIFFMNPTVTLSI